MTDGGKFDMDRSARLTDDRSGFVSHVFLAANAVGALHLHHSLTVTPDTVYLLAMYYMYTFFKSMPPER